jgi:hypothetical protein
MNRKTRRARRFNPNRRAKLVVATYLVDRAYGGPEEGGWWYDCGQLVRVEGTFFRATAAKEHSDTVQLRLDRSENLGRPDINSVCCEGVYETHIYERYAPRYFPKHRPTYQ